MLVGNTAKYIEWRESNPPDLASGLDDAERLAGRIEQRMANGSAFEWALVNERVLLEKTDPRAVALARVFLAQTWALAPNLVAGRGV